MVNPKSVVTVVAIEDSSMPDGGYGPLLFYRLYEVVPSAIMSPLQFLAHSQLHEVLFSFLPVEDVLHYRCIHSACDALVVHYARDQLLDVVGQDVSMSAKSDPVGTGTTYDRCEFCETSSSPSPTAFRDIHTCSSHYQRRTSHWFITSRRSICATCNHARCNGEGDVAKP